MAKEKRRTNKGCSTYRRIIEDPTEAINSLWMDETRKGVMCVFLESDDLREKEKANRQG